MIRAGVYIYTHTGMRSDKTKTGEDSWCWFCLWTRGTVSVLNYVYAHYKTVHFQGMVLWWVTGTINVWSGRRISCFSYLEGRRTRLTWIVSYFRSFMVVSKLSQLITGSGLCAEVVHHVPLRFMQNLFRKNSLSFWARELVTFFSTRLGREAVTRTTEVDLRE